MGDDDDGNFRLGLVRAIFDDGDVLLLGLEEEVGGDDRFPFLLYRDDSVVGQGLAEDIREQEVHPVVGSLLVEEAFHW